MQFSFWIAKSSFEIMKVILLLIYVVNFWCFIYINYNCNRLQNVWNQKAPSCEILWYSRIHCCMCVLHRWFFELLIKKSAMSQKKSVKARKGERIPSIFLSLSHSRLDVVRFQISICKVNFQRIGLNRRVSLSRLLRTEKPFKNIFFYAVARHEMMVSGYEKKMLQNS